MTLISPPNATIRNILSSFAATDLIYKRQAVSAALEAKQEIIPYLFQILENIIKTQGNGPKNLSHIYACCLLGHFQETSAHPILLRLFSLPEENLVPLFGTFLAENLPALLYQTCDGRIDGIKALISYPEAFIYCRASAITALSYAWAGGIIKRQEVVSFLRDMISKYEDTDSILTTHLVNGLYDLHPEGAMDEIRKAFAKGKVDQSFIDLETVEHKAKTSDPSRSLEGIRFEIKQMIHGDFHQYLQGLEFFNRTTRKKPDLSKTGRNSPCFCGSGKKYKKCCLNKI